MTRTAAKSFWTGELLLDLRDTHKWSPEEAELSVRFDTVIIRHRGLCTAVMDRAVLRDWLTHPQPGPLTVDDATWSVETGMTFLRVTPGGRSQFRITAESLALLVAVI